MARHEHEHQSTHPLDITPLQNAYSVTEGAKHLLLGKSKRLALANGAALDVYPQASVVSVETPLFSLVVTGVEIVSAGSDAIEFLAQRDGQRATLALLEGGEVIFHSTPVSPAEKEHTTSETKDTESDFSIEPLQIEPAPSPAPSASSVDLSAHTEQKQRVYQTKFNLGSDPFSITTTDGQMYVVLAYIRESNGKPIPAEKSKAVKVAVSPQEQDFIIDPGRKTEQNSRGYLFRKGDFVKGALIKRDFGQLTGKPGSTKEIPVRGYAFTEPPSMLSPKQKPGR